jgi:hypothetical protein
MNLLVENNELQIQQHTQMNKSYFGRSKVFIIILSILCSYTYGHPKIILEKNPVDLGVLETGGQLYSERLNFKNEGTDSLEVRYIGSSCGCTRIKEIQDKIEPGDSGYIVIEVDPSKARSGVLSQRLLLETNDPENKALSIKVFSRTKLAEVELFPKKMSLQLTTTEVRNQQGNVKNKFFILDTWPGRLEIVDIETSKYVRTMMDDIVHRCELGGETHIIRFDTRLTNDLPTGRFHEWVKLKTNHPEYPEITIPIDGVVQSGLMISPKMIMLSKKNKKVLLRFSVDDEDKKVRVDEVKSKAAWLNIEKNEENSSNCVEYSVCVNEEYIKKQQTNFMQSEIHITFSEPEKGVRIVKVLYYDL